MKKVDLLRWGLIDYKQAWDQQEAYFQEGLDRKVVIKNQGEGPLPENRLVTCQHPHVYTLGKSGKPENLLLNDVQLAEAHATYYKINRGGDITYHGPGQLVIYPLLDLEQFFTDLNRFIGYLETAVIRTCADYGIEASSYKGYTGVWIEPGVVGKERKICAMGLKNSRWMTMHGLAFNVNTDLNYFKNIVPCGIDDKDVTSLEKELGKKLDFNEVEAKMLGHLADLFEIEFIEN